MLREKKFICFLCIEYGSHCPTELRKKRYHIVGFFLRFFCAGHDCRSAALKEKRLKHSFFCNAGEIGGQGNPQPLADVGHIFLLYFCSEKFLCIFFGDKISVIVDCFEIAI